ncbi:MULTISPECIES: hypothetical protein [unclassified Streptomyces]|uniref:hypothetical protein n=1 Tax=unclassified Streptomyces TaxID=2593676 RepID=UPI000CD53903|nr:MULTISPECIES: hypothetical protein [unclassified Streptomyces]
MTALHVSPVGELAEPPTAATRHLCAGVYVSEQFRDVVVGEVCTAPHRRVAPSYGFDIVPVMRHAWRAALLSAIPRIAMLAAVVVPALLGSLLAAVLVACGLAFLWRLRRLIALVVSDSRITPPTRKRRRRVRAAKTWSFREWLLGWKDPEKVREVKRFIGIAIALCATCLVLASASPEQALLALCLSLALGVIALAAGAARQVQLNRIHRASTLRPKRMSRRQRVADEQQRHPCAVYRRPQHGGDEDDLTMFTLFGEESPFVGAGELVHQWNPPMSVQLLRPSDEDAPLHEREHPTPPFQAHELVEHLRKAVQELQSDNREVRLPVQVRDRVYIAETDVSVDRDLLQGRISDAEMHAIINTPGVKQYHFLEIITPMAGSELIATVLLRVNLQGRTLSLSSAACVLTRTPRSFQLAEEFGHNGTAAVALAALRGVCSLPREVGRSWRGVRYICVVMKAALLPRDLTGSPIRNLLIGTRVSVREEPAQAWAKVQLEKTEILGHVKAIEQRLLRAVSDFLYSRDVDTSSFSDSALKIINSGIFNIGDNNTFNDNAVGNGAQVGAGGQQGDQKVPSGGGKQ